MNSCVYIHKRATDGSVFYVGKGSVNRSKTHFERSEFWTRVVNKHGLIVEIVSHSLSESDAFDLEISLIKFYGRIDNGTGILVNHTDGGEGSSGYRHTDDARRKISIASRLMSRESRNAVAEKRGGQEIVMKLGRRNQMLLWATIRGGFVDQGAVNLRVFRSTRKQENGW